MKRQVQAPNHYGTHGSRYSRTEREILSFSVDTKVSTQLPTQSTYIAASAECPASFLLPILASSYSAIHRALEPSPYRLYTVPSQDTAQ